tara:strand:+ start:626 stop:913 length:288 start_codon:yes stop_codon:yes gene_type:complete
MFDWIKRLFYGELEKDKVRKWGMDKIKQEEEEAIFQKKMNETPSFSKCVISNRVNYDAVSGVGECVEKSQKQTEQLKGYNLRSYKDAVLKKEIKL